MCVCVYVCVFHIYFKHANSNSKTGTHHAAPAGLEITDPGLYLPSAGAEVHHHILYIFLNPQILTLSLIFFLTKYKQHKFTESSTAKIITYIKNKNEQNPVFLTKYEERIITQTAKMAASTTSGGISEPLLPRIGVNISNTAQMRYSP